MKYKVKSQLDHEEKGGILDDCGPSSMAAAVSWVSGTGVQLARLEMADAMGQRSVLGFDRIETNPTGLGASGFQFSPPAGVEVLRP